MSGGQDEASERINVGDLPYWLAGPIKRLEARVERLERYDPELLLAKIACLEQEAEQRCKPPVCGRCNRQFVAGVNAYLPSCDCFAVNADGSVTLKDQGPNSEWAKEARKLAEWCANLEKWICEADKRIGSLDKQAEQLKVGNDDADSILSDLLQRVQRLEDGRPKQPATDPPDLSKMGVQCLDIGGGVVDQPVKRREWWVVFGSRDDWGAVYKSEAEAKEQRWLAEAVRVIAAPSEAEIEAAVNAGVESFYSRPYGVGPSVATDIRAAIRKLLGGGE